jgi:peptidyl-dipeptidase Dcp
VRKAKYDLDEKSTKPFEIATVSLEKVCFSQHNKMYGITFKERMILPVYHPDVKVYEVYDNDENQSQYII